MSCRDVLSRDSWDKLDVLHLPTRTKSDYCGIEWRSSIWEEKNKLLDKIDLLELDKHREQRTKSSTEGSKKDSDKKDHIIFWLNHLKAYNVILNNSYLHNSDAYLKQQNMAAHLAVIYIQLINKECSFMSV